MCKCICPCFYGAIDFKAYFCCSGGCGFLTWASWCCNLYAKDNSDRCKNCAFLPLTGLPVLLFLLLSLWGDLWNFIIWAITLGQCGQRCKFKCGTVNVSVSDGCPTLAEWMEVGKDAAQANL